MLEERPPGGPILQVLREAPVVSAGTPTPLPPAPPKARRKPSWCCCCCLGLVLVLLLTIGGFLGAGWWFFAPEPSQVQIQHDSLPEYFPPEAPP